MNRDVKKVRINITIDPNLLKELKMHVKDLNSDLLLSKVTQSSVISNAIEQLLHTKKM